MAKKQAPTQGQHKQVGPGGTGMGATLPGSSYGIGSTYNPYGQGSASHFDPLTGNHVKYNPTAVDTGGGNPPPPGGSPGGYSSRGRGGGGGGGGVNPDWGKMAAIMGFTPQKYKFQNYTPEMYKGTGFYDFDSSMYDRARQGVQEGLAADLASGQAAYGDAMTELQQYQNPFAGRSYSTNPQMSGAMQRMLAANNAGVTGGPTEQARGVQADQAFGNVLALLGGAADQRQGAEMRALGGDERRFNESLQSEGRGMNLGIDMALANARSQYEKDKWQYGEEIAQQNYQARTQAAMYNNQGLNQTNQANVAQGNEYFGGNMQWLLDLVAQGKKPPEMLIAHAAGLQEGGKSRY